MSQPLSLTWITPKWPFPADDGARQATTQLLKQLTALGVAIDLCAIVPDDHNPDPEEAMRKLGVRSATLVKRGPSSALAHLKNLLLRPWVPLTIAPYASARVRAGIERALAKRPGNVVVYDGLHSAGWRVGVHGRAPISVYRAHNVERDLWIRGAKEKKNPLTRLFLRLQARLMSAFEERVSREARVLFPVSQIDADIFSRWLDAGSARPKIASLPIGIAPPSTDGVQHPPKTPSILFVGRLDWPPNRDGLRWFLDRVWTRAIDRRPELSLTIVGSGDGSWLEPYRTYPGVNFLGRVDSLAPHYAASVASIVPVFFGSGTRVKAIESCLYSRACIGTEVGVEGVGLVPGQTYYHVEEADQWIDTLVTLDPLEAIARGQKAHDVVSRTFDPKKIAEKFIATLKEEGLP